MKNNLYRIMMFAVIILLSGCSREKKADEQGPQLYYLNKEETQIVSEDFDEVTGTKSEQMEIYINALDKQPEHRGYKKVKPEEVKILEYKFEGEDELQIYFDSGYSTLTGITEILCRAAIVKTFSQIPGVKDISFYVNGQPIMLEGEVPVGLMRAENFIDSAGKFTTYTQEAYVTLYFADRTGTKLIESHRYIKYEENISMEQLIVEQLIAGPDEKESGIYNSIPSGTSYMKASTKNGICYLDLNDKFLEKLPDVTEEVTIYSIVNSLVELTNINKVQLSVNGEIKKVYQSVVDISIPLERNLNLVDSES